ncbi:hypothetical protein BGZ47_003886, partial [Haplosporangium gracile]
HQHQQQQYQHLQHPQQHHQHHQHQQPPQHPPSTSSTTLHDHHHPVHNHEHDGTGHCCDAMVEIQQLRQERDWYRSLAKKTNDGSGSEISNSSQYNGRMITSP